MPPRWATEERPLPPLLEAAWSGGTAVVRALLDSGADAAEANATGDTALHWAAGAGDVASVGVLLAAGTCVTAMSERGSKDLYVIQRAAFWPYTGRPVEEACRQAELS